MAGISRSAVGVAIAIAAVLLTVAPGASADSVARAVAGAEAPRPQLERTSSSTVPGGGVIERFQQEVGGLPVLGAEVVVVDGPETPAMLVSDHSVDGIGDVDAGSAISRAAAIATARDAVGTGALRSPATAELGIAGASGKLVWEVTLLAADPLADWLVRVDAVSGEKLSARDVLLNATGTAALFNPNPVTQQGSYQGLKDKNDRDYSRLTQLLAPVTLDRLLQSKCLKGTYADVRDARGKKVCAPGADFTGLTRSDEDFEAVMAYFHIDRTRAYVDSLLLSQPLRQKAQKVFTNAIPEDQSYYSSNGHELVLGTGGIDDGEDADVIVHEYGHSLQDQAAENSLRKIEGQSLGEGFGDYMAAVMSNLTTGGSDFDTCIFDWDGIPWGPDGKCGRYADLTVTLSKAKQVCGGIQAYHCVSQAWSSAMFELRALLGADVNGQAVMDRVVLEANFLNAKKTDFRDAARGLLAADQLLYAGAHVAQIQAELTQRKFCPAAC